MHFALPPRKTSQPPPYARAAAKSLHNRRKSQARIAGFVILSVVTFLFLLRTLFYSSGIGSSVHDDRFSDDEFNLVIVTVLDNESMSEDYIQKIKTNREDYATRHGMESYTAMAFFHTKPSSGYTTFYTNTSTYKSLYHPSPRSWALIPALRHTLTLHPKCTHVFSLTPYALITNSSFSLTSAVLAPTVLTSLMIKDLPVVPPDSVIHTFSHLTPSQTHLILSQDLDNLAHTSLILRNSDWSHYFLDAWFDPLYRAYNFQKAEGHALEHIVQWHPTILAKLVVINQRKINSYNFATAPQIDMGTGKSREHDSKWQPGDFVVNLKGCEEAKERDCEKEMNDYYKKWENEIRVSGGVKSAAVKA